MCHLSSGSNLANIWSICLEKKQQKNKKTFIKLHHIGKI